MRVLILNGSPRPKGNTKQMITAFCEGLESAGHEWDVYDIWRTLSPVPVRSSMWETNLF